MDSETFKALINDVHDRLEGCEFILLALSHDGGDDAKAFATIRAKHLNALADILFSCAADGNRAAQAFIERIIWHMNEACTEMSRNGDSHGKKRIIDKNYS